MADPIELPEAFPLQWPKGVPRTVASERQSARFKTTLAAAMEHLRYETELFPGKYLVVSSNLPLRADGKPSLVDRAIVDPGVAVYLHRRGQVLTFACDRWRRIEDNIQAIRLTINALRGIERWGSAEMMNRAFSGFAQLPAPENATVVRPWWEVLGVKRDWPLAAIEGMFRDALKKAHPDKGGSADRVAELNVAIGQAREEKR